MATSLQVIPQFSLVLLDSFLNFLFFLIKLFSTVPCALVMMGTTVKSRFYNLHFPTKWLMIIAWNFAILCPLISYFSVFEDSSNAEVFEVPPFST